MSSESLKSQETKEIVSRRLVRRVKTKKGCSAILECAVSYCGGVKYARLRIPHMEGEPDDNWNHGCTSFKLLPHGVTAVVMSCLVRLHSKYLPPLSSTARRWCTTGLRTAIPFTLCYTYVRAPVVLSKRHFNLIFRSLTF